MKKIYIDGRVFSEEKIAGVGRYINTILEFMVNYCDEVILVSNKPINRKIVFNSDKINFEEHTKFRMIPGSLFIMFIIPFLKRYKGCNFWGANHCIPIFRMNTLVSIHDIVAFKYGQTMTLKNKYMVMLSTLVSLFFSKKISTVSEFTKKEIISYFKFLDKKEISVFQNTINNKVFFKKNIANNEKHHNYILAVGTIEPRKNIKSVLNAFNNIKDSGYEGFLVLIGGKTWKSEELFNSINLSPYKEYIKIKGWVNDEELNDYYNKCDVFVFPSIYEGFGIPPIEALYAGSKVICTTNCELALIDPNQKYHWSFDPLKDDLFTILEKSLKSKKNEFDVKLLASPRDVAKKILSIFN